MAGLVRGPWHIFRKWLFWLFPGQGAKAGAGYGAAVRLMWETSHPLSFAVAGYAIAASIMPNLVLIAAGAARRSHLRAARGTGARAGRPRVADRPGTGTPSCSVCRRRASPRVRSASPRVRTASPGVRAAASPRVRPCSSPRVRPIARGPAHPARALLYRGSGAIWGPVAAAGAGPRHDARPAAAAHPGRAHRQLGRNHRGGAVRALPVCAPAGQPVGRDHAARLTPVLHGPDGRSDHRAGPGPDHGERGSHLADPGRRPVRRAVRAAGPGLPATPRSRPGRPP